MFGLTKKNQKKSTKRKNILITGGAGFIGSHLCERLVKNNNVICLDTFVTSKVENIRFLMQTPNFVFIKHDLSEKIDFEAMAELKKFQINVFGISEIYNLACPTSAKNFNKLVVDTSKANSVAIKNVLDLALKYGSKLIHASSAVVYGPRTSNKYVKEDYRGVVDFKSPRACYDEGKRFAETMLSTYNDFYKKDFKVARIFRTYGPRLALNDGQMISDFILNALDDKDLVIYGDKKFSTSLCYVSDIVDGLIKLMKSDYNKPMNLGSNMDVSLTEVAEKIITMVQSKSKIVHKKSLDFITPLVLPDIGLAKSKLGWYPLVSLENGLNKTLEYTRAHKQLLTNLVNNNHE